jgi:glycogen synthase kinase 3 beta
VIREIYSGEKSSVYEIEEEKSGSHLAVKIIVQDPNYKSLELGVLQCVDSPNCMRLVRSWVTRDAIPGKTFLNIVSELFPMTLLEYMTAKKGLPSKEVRSFAFQLFRALRYLRWEQIVHGDVCPENILVDPETGRLQLCDFGDARLVDDPADKNACRHSLGYRPPEMILGFKDSGHAVDEWAAGVVIVEMICGERLFKAESVSEMQREIKSLLGEPSSLQWKEMETGIFESGWGEDPRDPNFAPSAKERILASGLFSLLTYILEYSPLRRLGAGRAICFPCFDEYTGGHSANPPLQVDWESEATKVFRKHGLVK